jgi:hypothetical protein
VRMLAYTQTTRRGRTLPHGVCKLKDYGRLRKDVVVEWLTGVSPKRRCWDFDGCF